jgi:hypothetical protein
MVTGPSSSDESSSTSGEGLAQVLRTHSSMIPDQPPTMTMPTMEQSAELSSVSSISDDANASAGITPVFFQLLPLHVQCEEGERLLLTSQVMAGAQCEVRWLFNDTILHESQLRTRRHYNPDTGICFLIIDPTLTYDSGLYRLIIINRSGQAQSTCQVEIQTRQLLPMPDDAQLTDLIFVQPLSSVPLQCHDGDTIQLTCVIHGRRPIQVRWYKDEQIISIDAQQQHARQMHFDTLTGKSTLIIHDTYPNDGGIYRCEAANRQGKRSTSMAVEILRMLMMMRLDVARPVFSSCSFSK